MFFVCSIRLDRLERFNSEGCENLSDNAFKYLLVAAITALTRPEKHSHEHFDNRHLEGHNEEEEAKVEFFCSDCTQKYTIEEMHQINRKYLSQNDSEQEKNEEAPPPNGRNRLKYINLSGCWSITDFGLR